MIKTGFETRVKVQQIIENQLPEFLRSESPKAVDFLKQYYISQEYQGAPADLANNLDQYLKIDNLTPEVISGTTTLSSNISSSVDTVQVGSTKGFPAQYGLFQIDDEIFTYTGITTNTFTGCVRGFSGITSYRSELNPEELVFKETEQAAHTSGATVKNLSSEFLKEFYKKLKYTFTPGLEDVDFVSNLDVNNFIKEARSLYESKGTEESFKILFRVLYGVTPKVYDLEDRLVKPSSAQYVRREIVVAERVSGDPNKLVGQTIKKSSDSATQASVSEVEIFTRSGISTYFKIGLFIGYDDRDLIEGTFEIQPKTKVINPVSAGASTIIVDSTIGFPAAGTLISGNNTITYTSKTVNEFLGCSGVDSAISTKDDITTDEVFYGYEDGDITKKVEIRLTGVLSKFETISDIKLSTEGQKVYVKNVGEKIANPELDKTYKQLFANSWIYNTSSRYQVDSISGSNFVLKSEVDKSSLRVGDVVDILLGSTENVAHSNAVVASVSGNQITLNNLVGFTADSTLDYSIRRKLETATSSGTPIIYGNNTLTSNIQSLYNENDEYFYVASNSLPSYDITKTIKKATIAAASSANIKGYNSETEKYSIISFTSSVPFITGDEVYYKPEGTALSGLSEGYYYVKVLTLTNQIKLYLSRSLIVSDNPIEFTFATASGAHNFTLSSQKDGVISPQKILKKFPNHGNIKVGNDTQTIPGSTGILVNGVELINYKSEDKIYYGPLDSISLYNGGSGYDVINPPEITISAPSSGTTALVRPALKGHLQEVIVDKQDFDIKRITSVTLTGGNGTGAILQPVLEKRYREIEFDSRVSTSGGGIDITADTLTFTTSHNLSSGDAIIYNRNGNSAVGVGSFGGSNADLGTTLSSGSVYYAQVVNGTTIKLYESQSDYSSGINTVGFTTSNTQGIHKFKTFEGRNTLRSIKVINPGSGYENKKLIVKLSNVSISEDNITFENHGFSDGDIVNYTTTGTAISGLSTSVSYYIIKQNDDKFRLANAGVGATIKTNYERGNYVNLLSVGSGYHNFSYEDIQLNISAEYDGPSGIITATPIVVGEITNLYLYENGTGYGSEVLNFHKRPSLTIKTGKDAEIKPIVSGGKIVSVQVTNAGSEYTSAPLLTVSGIGIGGKLRAVVSAGKITEVVIINAGVGYDSNTIVTAIPMGKGAFAEASVRSLTVNNQVKYGDEILSINPVNLQGIEYGLVGYTTSIGNQLYDTGSGHSPIIGWAYDGNPIYGCYGYSDSTDSDSAIKILSSGYSLSTSDITDRPSSFSSGFFVEDYKYTNSGDLDQYNGRFCKTPEFPNGIYAYFASISSSTYKSVFPYFIGNTYRSLPVLQTVDQDFDFNNSELIRNTFPYKVGDRYADNDFIYESNEVLVQSANIDSITKGSVDNLYVNLPGSGYAVGDIASFDNTDTFGGGLSADVKSIVGKSITDLATSIDTYTDAKIIWEDSNTVSFHIDKINTIVDGDSVVVSGLSTFISGLTKSHLVGVTTEKTYLIKQVPTNATSGVVTDIYVSKIPVSLSIGSTVAIGTERLSVINIFPENKVVRALRGVTGTAHTASTEAAVLTGKLTASVKTPYFNSRLNDKVYFNASESIAIGTTTGTSVSKSYTIGDLTKNVSVPIQSIYLPNHPFKTSQPVVFSKVSGSNSVSVSNTETSGTFNIPSGNSQTLYVINKSKDYIGLTTQVGLTTNTGGLYFRSFTANGDDTDYQYALESNYTQVTAKVEKIVSTLTVSESHLLTANDTITLTVNPSQSAGINTTDPVVVKYNSTNNKLLINPIGFTSSSVQVNNDRLSLGNHGLKTGDKVFYSATGESASGLSTGSYYVYRINDNLIQLGETLIDVNSAPPTLVSIASSGGSQQELSLINPQIPTVRNNNLVFDVSHSSLSGYNFKIFEDRNFYNELVSTGSTTTFSVSGVGTVGVSTNATVTLDYSENLPTKLYYSLEKSGYISTSDTDVKNNSEILFKNSVYNGNYSVSGLGTNTFKISLDSKPESLNYTQTNTDILKYTTTSLTARGGVDSMRITSKGTNYKELPKFVSIASTTGRGVDIIPQSTNIGRIKEITIEDQGFDFSADKTLSPEAFVSPIVNLVNRNTITGVSIVSGGSNYTSAPDLIIVNPITYQTYSNGILDAKLTGSSISKVDIIETPRGLSDSVNKVFAVNNSNGIGIKSCVSSTSGIITCILRTPIAGFSTDAFTVGERVFLENIVKFGSDGEGFNSENHQYNFFPVIGYTNSNPAQVVVDISDYTTNAGIALTEQGGYASIIKKSNYPVFSVAQETLTFIVGEKLLTLDGSIYVERDLIVTENLSDSVKVYGSYELSDAEVILGKDSGTIATIESITNNRAFFRVNYSLKKDIGWSNDIGKLNEDYQVIADNDYYQNLSYSVSSPIEYTDLINPVNRLLHTSGLKNFADTEVLSESLVSIGKTNLSSSIALIDIIGEKRVDTINSYDFALDIDTLSQTKSKFVKLQNKKLSSYIKCLSNRVISIDDIKSLFSSGQGDTELYADVDDYDINSGYNRFLVQIVNPNSSERQTTEIITLPSVSGDIITVEKGSVYNRNTEIGELTGFISDVDNNLSLRFIPSEKYNSDYDIKILKNNFSSNIAGIGTQTVGFVNLTGSNVSVASATTSTIFNASTSNIKSLFVNAEVKNTTTNQINYVEMYIDHNGTDTNFSEYFFDNDSSSEISDGYIGTFTASISSGIISLKYENTESDSVFVKSKVVGFGTTASGIGTYRFKSSGQPDGSEKTARLQTNFISSSGVSTIFTLSSSDVTSVKSIARVGYGNTSSLHQILVVNDGTDSYVTQYPFLSNNSVTGIGTFGAEISGSNLLVKFYPDASITDTLLIQTYSEVIQTESDLINIPEVLTYGSITETLDISAYNGRNGDRVNRLDFDMKHEGNPIFEKTFNPSDTDVLNASTGVFKIKDHYFNTGEKLLYSSASSFTGISASDIQVSGASSLPNEVYAIRVNNDEFKLATSESNANSGVAVTFSSAGSGNAHKLEMNKKMEKSIVTIDGVVQSPIAFTPLNYTLTDNGGSIGAAATYFSISGISSILPGDLLRIDDEYVKVDSVGLGTTSVGPITGTGSFNLIKSNRGFVGSSATTHNDGATARVYIGSFNIVGSKIFFTEPPRGNSTDAVDASNIPTPRSSFGGRVYLRQDYSTNQIYDNISKSFTGIGQTYTLTVGGANTTGIETGSGVLFINNIFQTPTTENNVGNNYSFSENVGVSSVIFTGITTSGGILISDYDVNQNQLPRGGIIVSLGSTPGLGYAPLVGASVTAVVGAGGSIVSVGLGSTDIVGSGYNGIVSIGISVYESGHVGDVASITASVGAGGTLTFNVGSGGTGYSSPAIFVSEPSYEDLEVVGVSRVGLGATTDTGTGLLVSLDVSASSRTGIGSTLFEVSSFKISRPGYGFRVGDVFTPVGLVTDRNVPSAVEQFEITVIDTFSDSFSSWQFGELDFIDPIDTLINGSRVRFPLYYNGNLLSFEIDTDDDISSQIDMNYVLLIFINGVIQEPGVSYTFEGGTTFSFTTPPQIGDNVDIFFYRGTRNTDSLTVQVNETIKPGDSIQIQKNVNIDNTVAQDLRYISNIVASDTLETDIYTGLGIDETNYKPFDWTKQKVDFNIGGEIIYKSRDSIEAQIYPTARIIGDLSTSDTEIFVDDAQFFNYEENESSIVISDVNALIVTGNDPVAAAITAVVSAAGTISSLSIGDGGSGYTGSSVTLSIAAPKSIGVGVGTTATATASITSGIITAVSITNPGFGYTTSNPPIVLAPTSNVSYENIIEIDTVQGFSGIITGISTTTGTSGNPLAIQFFLNSTSFTGLSTGYPIYIFDTTVGSGVTSIDTSDSAVVGIGTSFANNIYTIHTLNTPGGSNANIIVNVDSGTNTTGLSTTGSTANPVGRFSWGRLSGFTRASSPISIGVTGLTVDSGLTTFPTIQRRGYGLRDTGSLRKDLG